MGMKNIMNLLD